MAGVSSLGAPRCRLPQQGSGIRCLLARRRWRLHALLLLLLLLWLRLRLLLLLRQQL